MRRKDLLGLGFAALALPACTVIVGNELSKYDIYTTSDTGSVGAKGDPCALTAPDAGNACSACIATSCPDQIGYACKPDGATKPWFKSMTSCAENPVTGYVGTTYEYAACSTYDRPDAQPIGAEDDSAEERAALICVRDNCYANSPTPPCNQCSVGIEKPGTAAGVAVLHDSDCGQCLEAACAGLLVQCCSLGIPPDLKKCAYPQEQTFRDACVALLQADAGNAPTSRSSVEETCAYNLATTCYAGCVTRCQAGR